MSEKYVIYAVDDEESIRELYRYALESAGFEVSTFGGGDALFARLSARLPDLILLDIMLPNVDGFELMEYIRPLGIPVIFLTAKNAVADRVKGLRMGAEDYIVKPFEILELLTRVDVVLRRYNKTATVIEIGGLVIDTQSMIVRRDGEEIALTRKEYELLLLFARNPNTALYRETIYERVWGGDYNYGTKTVDLHVQRLRKKVGWNDRLQAVSKVGYRLEI